MAALSLHQARRVAAARSPWCVTIYANADSWLHGNRPTENARAQLRAAVDDLARAQAPRAVTSAIHARLDEIAEPAKAAVSADRRIRSVGIFATEDGAEVIPLTTMPAEWVGASDRFLVGPLVEAAFGRDRPVYVLSLSESAVRLIDATAHPAAGIDTPGLPSDLRTTIPLDLTGDRDTLGHLRTSEDPKLRLREYVRAIDRAVIPVVRPAGARLVVAAAEPLAGIFRTTTGVRGLVPPGLAGNHDEDGPEHLAELAAPIVEELVRNDLCAQLTRLVTQDPDHVLSDIDRIEQAAGEGDIDTLFVDTDHRTPVLVESCGRRVRRDRVTSWCDGHSPAT